jgi:polyvinyl alcohol dehydrogenase (cytochrome)
MKWYLLPAFLLIPLLAVVTSIWFNQHVFTPGARQHQEQSYRSAAVQSARLDTKTNWSMFGGDLAHTSYNPNEHLITQANANTLRLKWGFRGLRGVSGQPVVVNDRIFWGDWNGHIHATTLSGKEIWSTFLGAARGKCRPMTSAVAGTAAVAMVPIKGVNTEVVFIGGGDTNLYALNAATGAVLWRTFLGETPDNFIWGPPTFYNGHIYVGVSSYGDCPLTRGNLVEVNAATGTVEHIFFTVASGCSGGGVWDAPTIDTTTGMLYVSTGTRDECPTDEIYATGLLKLRASDLSLVDYWRVPANWTIPDGDFGSTPTLFQATISGVVHPMVGLINKNGVYYAFDRNNLKGGPLWQARLGTKQVISKVNMSTSAYDGKALYIGSGFTRIGTRNCNGSLRAISPNDGKVIWELCLPDVPFDSAMAIPGLVVIGADAATYVVNSQNGKVLFHYTDLDARSTLHLYSWGNPTIVNGVLYQGNLAGKFYAIGLP